MNSFDHMVMALEIEAKKFELPKITVESNPDKISITEQQYDEFLKEFVFEKLKGKTLAESFSNKFGIFDIIFELRISDDNVQKYIKKCYIK